MITVLIPAYEPDNELLKIVKRLAAENFAIVVVDDGSGEKYTEIFTAVKEFATLLTHEKNEGKGAALKTGMRYIKESLPDCEGFITCDADGQHRVEDVVRVAEKLRHGDKFVLTIRQRKKETKVPFRSKFGNSLSKFVYAMLTNRYLSDNQSGLRGFNCCHIDWMIRVERNKYDYEMNVLYYAAKMGLKVTTLCIDAIYIGNNESSHFSPVADTLRIYRSLFSLAKGTFITFALCEILILLTTIFLGYHQLNFTIPSIGGICYLVNTLLNRIFFKDIPKFDYLSNLVFTVISYFVYTLMCMLFAFASPQMPLILAFNIVFLVCIPLRYALHKFIFLASLTRE